MPHDPKPRFDPFHGAWRCRFQGRTIQRKSEAACLEELRRRQAAAGKLPVVPGERTVSWAIVQYKQSRPSPPHQWSIDAFQSWPETAQRLETVPRDFLERYVQYLQSPGTLAAASVVKAGRLARAIMDYAWRQGWLERPVNKPRLPIPLRNPRGLNRMQILRTMGQLPDCMLRPFRFALETGARPGETVKLRWSNVDLAGGVCVLGQHKTAHSTGRPRVLFLTPVAKEILSSQPRTGELVFRNGFGDPYTVPVFRRNISRAAQRAYRKRTHGRISNQPPAVTGMILRHTFAENAVRRLDLFTASRLLGHTSVTTTQHYASVRDPAAMAAAEVLRFVDARLDRRQKRKRNGGSGPKKKSGPTPSTPPANRGTGDSGHGRAG